MLFEGPYVDGAKHGHWVVRFDSGSLLEGLVEDCVKHGRWTFRLANGTTEVTKHLHGELVR